MTTQQHTTREVAEFLGPDEWRIRRLFQTGAIPEVPRFAGKRSGPFRGLGQVLVGSAFGATPFTPTPLLADQAFDVRNSIIDRATALSEENNVGLTRESFEQKALRHGDDVHGFASEVGQFFRDVGSDRGAMAKTGRDETLFAADERERRHQEIEAAQADIDSGFRYDWSWNRPVKKKAAEERRDQAKQQLAQLQISPARDESADRLIAGGNAIAEMPLSRLRPAQQSTNAEMAQYVTPDVGPFSDFAQSNRHWMNERTGFERRESVAATPGVKSLGAAADQDLIAWSRRLGGESAIEPVADSAVRPDLAIQPISVPPMDATPVPAAMSERAQHAWAAVAASKRGPVVPVQSEHAQHAWQAVEASKTTVPAQSERAQKAWAAVQASHGNKPPVLSERAQKAWAAVEASKSANTPVAQSPAVRSLSRSSAEPQEAVPRLDKVAFDRQSQLEMNARRDSELHPSKMIAPAPVVNVDIKQLASKQDKTNELLGDLIGVIKDLKPSADRSPTTSRGGIERTSTRPAAALSKQ